MDENAKTPDRLMELPEDTRQFLTQLRDDDLETLKDGLKLVVAIRTVGTFMKWMIVCFVGALVGFVMVWENILKLLRFITPDMPK